MYSYTHFEVGVSKIPQGLEILNRPDIIIGMLAKHKQKRNSINTQN